MLHFPKEDRLRIAATLREMTFSPYAGDIEKISGEDGNWRRRVGAYRIFYEMRPDEKVIFVYKIERHTSKTY